METKKLRVTTGIKIEVNDAGDCIVANVQDNEFVDKFYKLIELMENTSKELRSVKVDTDDFEESRKGFELIKEKTNVVLKGIDDLFGPDTCKKVFSGIECPNGYAIEEFFEQLVPIFQEFADERQKKIANRYTRRRKGKK